MSAGLVSIAFASNTLDAAPTWVGVDADVVAWTIDRGRQFETDRTEAGTATVTLVDAAGLLDALNGSSTYAGELEPLKQIRIQEINPVTSVTSTQFTGLIEDWDYTIDPTSKLVTLTLTCVDAFDIFANTEVVPDATGQAVYVSQQVDDALRARLADAQWDPTLTDIFTGNVYVKPVNYPAGTDTLTTLFDCADAEFPGVANLFMDRAGLVAFRGRLARFNPDDYTPLDGVTRSPSRPMLQWNCGDKAAVVGHSSWAKIAANGIDWQLTKIRIVNACLATPEGVRDADVPGQLSTDATSITKRSTRSLKLEGLLTDGHIPPSTTTDLAECKKFADYYKDNYAVPHVRVSRLVFQSVDPAVAANAGTWALLTGVEIGDLIFITMTTPGGGGLAAVGFFVDGIHQTADVGNAFTKRTLSLDVTPQSLYSTNPFV